MKHLFCFGLGYSAGVLAERLRARDWKISGTSTSQQGVAHIHAAGYHGYVYDGSRASPEIEAALKVATHILLSIPPNAKGDPAFANFADALAESPSLAWIGYFSTVGVYGDAAGGWVDETTPAKPASERGQRRLAAETQWTEFGKQTSKPVAIFRLPGIYGPGRSAIDAVREGTARRIIKPGQVFNRIHVADIASAVEAAIARPHITGVFNVTDDEPGPPQNVVSYAAELLSVPPPPDLDFATAELSAMARSFYSESKRVRNSRLKNELGVQLQYPSYREGLKAIAGHGG